MEDTDLALSASLWVWRFVFVRNLAVSTWSDLIILPPEIIFSGSELTNSSYNPDPKNKKLPPTLSYPSKSLQANDPKKSFSRV